MDPKYSMWISTDQAFGEYIPQAPVNDEAKQNNQNLPGMGGIFNPINTNLWEEFEEKHIFDDIKLRCFYENRMYQFN